MVNKSKNKQAARPKPQTKKERNRVLQKRYGRALFPDAGAEKVSSSLEDVEKPEAKAAEQPEETKSLSKTDVCGDETE